MQLNQETYPSKFNLIACENGGGFQVNYEIVIDESLNGESSNVIEIQKVPHIKIII